MEDYGLWFSSDSGMSLHENHDDGYSNIAFYSTEWGAVDENSLFQFSYPFGEYRALLWYRPDENLYDIRIEKVNSYVNYVYNVGRNAFETVSPDKAMVDGYLKDMYTDTEVRDLYAGIFRVLEQYTRDFAGLSYAELAVLPPAEGYARPYQRGERFTGERREVRA